MTIDQVSEILGGLRAEMQHQTKAIDKLQEGFTEIKDSLAHGSAKFTAINVRIDNLEQHISDDLTPHIEDYRAGKERRAGMVKLGHWLYLGIGGIAGTAASAIGNMWKAGMLSGGGH